MKAYIARRILLFIPTLLGVSIVVFVVLRIIPGDPAEAMLAGAIRGRCLYSGRSGGTA